MLNKKGSSLIELIISIALISVVLVFLIKLLVDINDTETNNDYAKKNQINRAEIVRTIENDLNKKVLTNITSTGSTESKLIIKFSYDDGKSGTITATRTTLTYKNSGGKTRKWTMNDATIYVKKADLYMSPDNKLSIDASNKIYTMTLNIEIHTQNDRNSRCEIGASNCKQVNNASDDIIIAYLGRVSEYTGNINATCLGKKC